MPEAVVFELPLSSPELEIIKLFMRVRVVVNVVLLPSVLFFLFFLFLSSRTASDSQTID